jgi:hypothetical protein
MKRELIPYYISRAALSALFGLLIGWQSGWWLGVLTGVVMLAMFVWYAHSGRYLIDPSRPLAPLRRDERGKVIRDRALVAGVVVGGLVVAGLGVAGLVWPLSTNLGSVGMLAGVITYFAVSNWLFVRR